MRKILSFFTRGRVDIAKNIAEMLALLIGGLWAWHNWNLIDKPALAEKRRAESTLSWAHRKGNSVHAEYFVTLTNTGTSSFEVDSARLRVWTFQYDDLDVPGQRVRYIDVNQIIKYADSLIFQKTFKDIGESKTFVGAPFVQKFEQGATWSDNFDFTFKLDTNRLALFCVQFYKKGCKEAFDWTYYWDPIGGEDTSKTKQKP